MDADQSAKAVHHQLASLDPSPNLPLGGLMPVCNLCNGREQRNLIGSFSGHVSISPRLSGCAGREKVRPCSSGRRCFRAKLRARTLASAEFSPWRGCLRILPASRTVRVSPIVGTFLPPYELARITREPPSLVDQPQQAALDYEGPLGSKFSRIPCTWERAADAFRIDGDLFTLGV